MISKWHKWTEWLAAIPSRVKLFIPFALLSAFQVFTIVKFQGSINVSVPQHGHFKAFEKVFSYITEIPSAFNWYKAFFISDFVWALAGLISLYLLIISFKDEYAKKAQISETCKANAGSTEPDPDYQLYCRAARLFLIISVLAYLLDVLENISYLNGTSIGGKLRIIVGFKEFAYGLSLIILLVVLFKKYIYSKILLIVQFLVSSLISISILLIIALLLSTMGQGAVIVIELVKDTANLIISLILITFLAQILSHYPTYFLAYVNSKIGETRDWKMFDRWKLFGFGTIYYNKDKQINIENAIRIWHHALGIVTFFAFVYIFLQVADSQQLLSNQAMGVSVGLFIVALICYVHYYKTSKDFSKETLLTWIAVLVALSFGIIILFSGWSKVGILATIGAILILLMAYSIFRIYRLRLNICSVPYLNVMRIFGTSILIFLIILNFYPKWSVSINPLNILLLYIIVYYSVVTLYVKHYLYYTDRKAGDITAYRSYKYLLPVLGLAIIMFLSTGHRIQNALHTLQEVEHHQKGEIKLSQFLLDLPATSFNQDTLQQHYYLGAYGGGIRANSWTLLVLNELQKRSDNNFIHSTVGLSGVSGGMIGLGNYTALFNKVLEGQDISHKIDSIATYNFLSLDLSMALGRDLVFEYIPGDWVKDRAYKAMEIYAKCTDAENGLKHISFQNFWSNVYLKAKKKDHHFPALFVNTTSTTGHQGIASSVNANQSLVPGSRSILAGTPPDHQLSYFMTLSTANRFPVLSPAARIKGLGHFVDGGNFENSGMLTAYHFYLMLKKEDNLGKVLKPHFINILNGKEEYLKWWIRSIEVPCIKQNLDENVSGEWAAVLNTVVSIDKIPNYVKNEIDQTHLLTEIPLPYPLTYEEVVKMIGGKSDCPDFLYKKISDHNHRLKKPFGDKLKNGLVTPSLARLQSIEVLNYQKTMLGSPAVDTILNAILRQNAILIE